MPIILCGGIGSRLVPLSTKETPKQFLNLTGKKSLFAETISRINDPDIFESPIIVGNYLHEDLIKISLAKENIEAQKIILEQVNKNSAPSIISACLTLQEDDIALILPSDHLIDEAAFKQKIKQAIKFCNETRIITFGITPNEPNVNFGYIEIGNQLGKDFYKSKYFHEKPDEVTAMKYLKSGNYLFNSGIFMFQAKAMLNEAKKHSPEILEICNNSIQTNQDNYIILDKKEFAKNPSISIDYAIIEKSANIYVAKSDFAWMDIGNWNSLYEYHLKNNRFTYLTKLLSQISSDQIIVTKKPWGEIKDFVRNDNIVIKLLEINPNQKISLQYHNHRSEDWFFISGEAEITLGKKKIQAKKNDFLQIQQGQKHRAENTGTNMVQILEIQTGAHLTEADIIRLEDDYARI